MQSTELPALLHDGTHVIPVSRIRRYAGSDIEGATGEIRWSPLRGITVRFEFAPSTNVNCLLGSQPSTNSVGTVSTLSEQPDWTCRLCDGTEVQLFGSEL